MGADQYAPAVLQAGLDLGITPKGIVIGFATVDVETDWAMDANEADPESLNYPHDGLSADENSDGLFQQRPPWWGTVAQRMDPYQSAVLFFTSLKAQRIGRTDDFDGYDYTTDATTPGGWAQLVQQSEFPDRYDARMADAQALYNQLTGGAPVSTSTPSIPAPPFRPDFNEYPVWSPNCQARAGTPVDLFLLHTQEGGGGDDAAADLASFLADPRSQVSYHYAISLASDGGVTVIDCVDTDDASWSVLDANNRSINLCFAGSYAAWSREDWIANAGRAIDVAAYLAAQDAIKYGIPTRTIFPPYGHPGGVSDHRYVTDFLGIGTHTDVGGPMSPPWTGFPWDEFDASFQKYVGLFTAPAGPADPGSSSPTPVDPPAPADPAPPGPAPDPVTLAPDPVTPAIEPINFDYEVLAQVRGRWGRLGKNAEGKDRTLIEAFGVVVDYVTGENNSDNGDFSW